MRLINVLLLIRLYCLVAANQFPVVEIESGPISGILSKTWKGRTIYSFQGIPYATPPVGKLRFQVNFVDVLSQNMYYRYNILEHT